MPYNGNRATPVFQWKSEAYSAKALVEIMLTRYDSKFLSTILPSNISHNVSSLIDASCLADFDDIRCDSMGPWRHSGSLKRIFAVERTKDDSTAMTVIPIQEEEKDDYQEHYTLKKIYSVNTTDEDIHKTIALLQGILIFICCMLPCHKTLLFHF